MNRITRTLLTFGTALGLTACGSVPTKTFDIRAINFDGDPVPCLIVVDRDFSGAVEAERYSDKEVTIAFTKDRMNVKLFPTRFANGKVVQPDPATQAAYYTETRDLSLADPRLHLFILRTNPDWVGN